MKFIAYVPEKKIVRTYLNVINSMLELTDREKDVLSILIELDLKWDSDNEKNIINMHSRRYIMQNTFINKNNLSKYIRMFKEKKVLSEYAHKKWCIDKDILPSTIFTTGEVNINFIIKKD